MIGQQKTGHFLPKSEEVEEYSIDNNYQEEKTQEQEALEELVAALDGDVTASVVIHREVNGNSSPNEFITRMAVDKFDHGQILEYLAKNYGGGDYRIRVYVKGRVRANKLFSIASPLRPGNSGVGDESALKMLMQQMEKMNSQLMQVMGERNSGGSRAEMMKEIMMMKEIFKVDAPVVRQGGGIGEILEIVSGLKELGVSVGGGVAQKEDTGFADLLNLAAPLFSNLSQHPVVSDTPFKNPVSPGVQQQQQQGADKMTMMIKAGLVPLLRAAAKNGDQSIYAQLVLDNVPEDKLIQFFNTPSGMTELIRIEPRVGNFVEWFSVLGEHVKACLGLPSAVGHLYDDEVSDSFGESDLKGVVKDERGSILSADEHTERGGGDQVHSKDDVKNSKKV